MSINRLIGVAIALPNDRIITSDKNTLKQSRLRLTVVLYFIDEEQRKSLPDGRDSFGMFVE